MKRELFQIVNKAVFLSHMNMLRNVNNDPKMHCNYNRIVFAARNEIRRLMLAEQTAAILKHTKS